jgi:hypothetical protein
MRYPDPPMRRWILLALLLPTVGASPQTNQRLAPTDGPAAWTIAARVLLFSPSVMESTYDGDLIVRVEETGRKVRLVYSPYDFGFDSPPADVSELLPKRMTTDGSLVWVFRVHAPANPREEEACRALSTSGKGAQGGPHKSSYAAVPGAVTDESESVASPECEVIQSWAGGLSNGAEPDDPVLALR